jgi:hypothetical protein
MLAGGRLEENTVWLRNSQEASEDRNLGFEGRTAVSPIPTRALTKSLVLE